MREDRAVIALAVEGGGSCGVVSGGMCLLLEKVGLIRRGGRHLWHLLRRFERVVHRCRAGSVGATNYLDVASSHFANPLRMLTGSASFIDFDYLFDELIANRKPYDLDGLAAGPSFRALGVELASSELRVLRDFINVEELAAAVRSKLLVAAAVGRSASGSRQSHGRWQPDRVDPLCQRAKEATHVLVLRSRPAGHRQDPYPRALIELARRAAHPGVAALLQARPGRYNAEAEHLQRLGGDEPCLLQSRRPTRRSQRQSTRALKPGNSRWPGSRHGRSRGNVRAGAGRDPVATGTL